MQKHYSPRLILMVIAFTSSNGNSLRIPLVDQFIQESKNKIYNMAVQNNIRYIKAPDCNLRLPRFF